MFTILFLAAAGVAAYYYREKITAFLASLKK